MKIKYKWKKSIGRRIKIKPEIAARELERIRRKNGSLRPEDLVQEAAAPSHPLHDYFQWDNSEAAKQYRLWQARHLIAVLVVMCADDDSDDPLTVRAYAHIQDERDDEDEPGDRHYVNIIEGMTDAVMRGRIIANALKELKAFRLKYGNLREFAALFAEVDRLTT